MLKKGYEKMNKLLKKIVSLTAVAAMSASFAVGVYAQEFTDMPSDWRTTAIENAVNAVLVDNIKTPDLADETSRVVGTMEMAQEIAKRI